MTFRFVAWYNDLDNFNLTAMQLVSALTKALLAENWNRRAGLLNEIKTSPAWISIKADRKARAIHVAAHRATATETRNPKAVIEPGAREAQTWAHSAAHRGTDPRVIARNGARYFAIGQNLLPKLIAGRLGAPDELETAQNLELAAAAYEQLEVARLLRNPYAFSPKDDGPNARVAAVFAVVEGLEDDPGWRDANPAPLTLPQIFVATVQTVLAPDPRPIGTRIQEAMSRAILPYDVDGRNSGTTKGGIPVNDVRLEVAQRLMEALGPLFPSPEDFGLTGTCVSLQAPGTQI